METTWKITACDSLTSDGFITTAQDGDFSGSVYSTCSWQPGTPTIPYAQVTEQEVLNWIWSSGVDKEATEAAVAAQIEAQKNPVTATGLPWA